MTCNDFWNLTATDLVFQLIILDCYRSDIKISDKLKFPQITFVDS